MNDRVDKSRGIVTLMTKTLDKSLSKSKKKNLEPGLVLNVSIWYKIKSNLDVHLSETWTVHFVQVHFTVNKIRPRG